MKNIFAAVSAFCCVALAQTTASVDPGTQIAFQTWANTNGFKVSLALPQAGGTDFIGQIQAPLRNSVGWAGISLGPSMLNNVLIATWVNNGKIQSSFRKATRYASPPPLPNPPTLSPLPLSTSANATHLTYTFLCSKCIPEGGALSTKLGWALSTSAVPRPDNVDGSLPYHMAGFGTFDVDLEAAKAGGGFEKGKGMVG